MNLVKHLEKNLDKNAGRNPERILGKSLEGFTDASPFGVTGRISKMITESWEELLEEFAEQSREQTPE